MYAVRILVEDCRRVVLKKALPEAGPHELLITQLTLFTGPQGGPQEPLCPLA